MSNANVTWSTSDTSVATVSSSGLVTAVGAGTARVVALSGSVADTTSVTVIPAVSSVTISPNSLRVLTGKTAVLVAKAVDSNGNDVDVRSVYPQGFSWTSSHGSTATVTSLGFDSARVSAGSPNPRGVQITASIGGKSASASVSVDHRRASKLSLDKDSVTLAAIGATVSLVATVTDQDGDAMSNANVTWSTSDTSVATVSSSGLVTAVAIGTARVVALSGSVTDTATITVRQLVSTVTIQPTGLDIRPNTSTGVKAKALDANGNEVDVASISASGFTWTSSSNAVVTVTPVGLDSAQVTAHGDGRATLTASIGGVSASINVQVSTVDDADLLAETFVEVEDRPQPAVAEFDPSANSVTGSWLPPSSRTLSLPSAPGGPLAVAGDGSKMAAVARVGLSVPALQQ